MGTDSLTETIREGHLASKRRSIAELKNFIDVRKQMSPSYGLLLGAGASYTSGVRTAGALVDEWRLIQYQKSNPDSDPPTSSSEIVQWLVQNEAEWYDKDREYSSLFQRMFDLKGQRRAFVETEVSESFPSIGYAYLIRLIENRYLNTIFTTNFDDLINEAFHQFSKLRPIVCAHDSSVRSINFSSFRPKIIKLHGDYLYDDLKSTVRETESLESNMKDKFIQLCQDIGLIVVGYSGRDRSIMELLDYLIKDDNYLRNGIYWCIRRGEEPSPELRKLLWKDRVYWVEIEGFDEFAGELYECLVGTDLPLNPSGFSDRSSEVYKKYLDENPLAQSSCTIIKRHLSELEKERNSDEIALAFKSVVFPVEETGVSQNEEGALTPEDYEINLTIQKHARQEDFEGILRFVDKKLETVDETDRRTGLLLNGYGASRAMSNQVTANRYIDELIELRPRSSRYLRLKSFVVDDYERKMELLDRAVNLNPFAFRNYNARAHVLGHIAHESTGAERDEIVSRIFDDLERSTVVNPSIENTGWEMLVDMTHEYRNSNLEDETERILATLEKQSLNSPVISRVLLGFGSAANKDIIRGFNILERIQQNRNDYFDDTCVEHDLVLTEALIHYNMTHELEKLFVEVENRPRTKANADFILLKASGIADILCDFRRAKDVIRSFTNYRRDKGLVGLLFQLHLCLDEFDEAEALLAECSRHWTNVELNKKRAILWDYRGNIDKALEYTRSNPSDKYNLASEATKISYLMLRKEDWRHAKRTAEEFLKGVNFDVRFAPLVLNYEFAHMKLKGSATGHKERLNNILGSNQADSSEKAVAHLLLGSKEEGLNLLREYIGKEFTRSPMVLRWPVIESVRDEVERYVNSRRVKRAVDPAYTPGLQQRKAKDVERTILR